MNEDGNHIGGISGFLKSLAAAVRQFNPTRCFVVFDGKGGSQRRKKIFPEYKERRKTTYRLNRAYDFKTDDEEHDAMLEQLVRTVEYLDALPVTLLVIENIEADDTIAYLVELLKQKDNNQTVIYSTDKDFLQLVDDKVVVWNPTRKKLFDEKTIKEEYGIPPQNFLLYRLIDGDASDNVPGVKGLGLKTILKKYPLIAEDKKITIDELLKYAKHKIRPLEKKQDKAYLSLLENDDILYRNDKLMNLSEVDISGSAKSEIRALFNSKAEKLNAVKFKRMFLDDKMWATLPNVESWLQTSFFKLNIYAEK